jgi:KaiC/GvpD/RAD55 family RecA-like ATPase
MRKIKSGILGLNPLLDGGINENSTTVVIGGSGAGKTTFATQFIRMGLEQGQEAIFVSLDENKEQIIREAVEMGWSEVLDYLDNEQLVFIDASGKDFSQFIKKELPSFVEKWSGENARIVIDPLTPVMWTTEDRYEQRELIGFLLKQTRKVGTVVCTLEEHGSAANLTGKEIIIPMYLADSVIHLRYLPIEDKVARTLKIVKCRSSRHSDISHPFRIIKGLGILVERYGYDVKDSAVVPAQLIEQLQGSGLPKSIITRITRSLSELIDEDFVGLTTEQVINEIMNEYMSPGP